MQTARSAEKEPFAALAAGGMQPFHASDRGELHAVDCLRLLKALPDDCIDLCVTSPPYERQPRYGNGEKYERDWFEETFLEITRELLRVMKTTGHFVLNFRSRRQGAERSVLQYELVMWLRDQGWLFAEDHVWVKPSPPPGRYRQAVKDQLEYCFRFAKSDKYELFPEQLLQPARWDARDRERRRKLAHNFERVNAPGGQGRKRVQAGPDWVAPGNALITEPEFSRNPSRHPARFPPAIPEYFIKLCTRPGDIVLDTFAGTSTAAVVAEALHRKWLMCELDKTYCAVLPERLDDLARRIAVAPTPDRELVPEHVSWVPLPFSLPIPKGLSEEAVRGGNAQAETGPSSTGKALGGEADQIADGVNREQLVEIAGHEDAPVAISDDGPKSVVNPAPTEPLEDREHGDPPKTVRLSAQS